MKKVLVLIFVISLFAYLFAGCAKKAEAPAPSTNNSAAGETKKDEQKPAESKGEVVELSVWHYFGSTDGPIFEGMCEEFNKSQNKIVVKPEFVPREELLKQYTIGLVADKLPDVGMIDNPDHASFAAMGLFEDITDRVKQWGGGDQFFEGPMKSAIYKGRIYGLPQNSNCLALWYDVDMLKAAGVEVPQTWDELAEAAKKLTKDGVYGLAISAPKNEEGTFQYLPWLLSAGADIEHLDSPEAIKSMAYLAALVKNGYMSKEVINWTQADAEKQFATGKAAMMINGPWNIPAVKQDAPNKKWAVAKVPKDKTFASVLGGENFGIIKGRKVDAGWEFLKYISSPEMSKKYAEGTGKFSPRKDVMQDSTVFKSDPILSVFVDQLQYAMPRGPHPKWPEISTAISTALQEALTGAKSAEQAMKDAQAKVSEMLKSK
ncbi:MAG: extracellular solute-binding protein family 1 [Clostridia bacterium]|nr:extracellular solute-binding protein family 1 [Clostridia bacterium]